jgi:hypothetical protein
MGNGQRTGERDNKLERAVNRRPSVSKRIEKIAHGE